MTTRAAQSIAIPLPTPRRDTLALIFIIVVLILPVGAIALASGFGLIALPYEMFRLDLRAPIIFRAHMVSAASALLLLPAVIGVRKRPEFHRPLGRLLGAFVVIGGLTALPVAIVSESTLAARAGFFMQGLVWLALLGLAYTAIRKRQISRHAHLMLAMAAVTTGAVWFRLITGAALQLHLPFEASYAFAAWAGWLIPLVFILNSRNLVARFMI